MLEQKLGLKEKSTKVCCTRIASALCLLGALSAPSFGRADEVTIVPQSGELLIQVAANSQGAQQKLHVVWDTEDKGGALANWANRQVLAEVVPAAGGTYAFPTTNLSEGCVVRAITTKALELIDGYTWMKSLSQYLDTGVSAKDAYAVEMGLDVTGKSGNWSPIIGVKDENFNIGCQNSNNAQFYLRYGGAGDATGPEVVNSVPIRGSQRNDIVLRAPDLLVNGSKITLKSGMTLASGEPVGGSANHIFLCRKDVNTQYSAYVKWYYVRLYGQDDELLRNYCPAKIGTTYGLYDAVEGTFALSTGGEAFTGAGTTTNTLEYAGAASLSFTYTCDPNRVATATWVGAGVPTNPLDPRNWTCENLIGNPVVDGVPGQYATVIVPNGTTNFNLPAQSNLVCRQVVFATSLTLSADCDWRGNVIRPCAVREYIDAPAGTYIDTDFKPNQDTRVVMDVTVRSGVEYWFGMWNVAHYSEAFSFCNDGGNSYTGFANEGGGGSSATEPVPVPNGRHLIELDKGAVKVDGSTDGYKQRSYTTFTGKYPIYLFGQNRKGTFFTHEKETTVRMHSCQIYDNGEKVRDFVPVMVDANTYGVFDRVGQKFYPCKGGAATFGEQTAETCLAYEKPERISLAAGTSIALNGHGLYLDGQTVDTAGSTTIANDSAQATADLHVDVASGTKVSNTKVALQGNLRFVKDGEGEFSAEVQNQTYTGGTLVADGRVTSPFSGPTSSTYDGSHGFFGRLAGVELNGNNPVKPIIEVGPNGTFDNNGNYTYRVYKFVLSGGTLANTGCAMSKQGWQGYFGDVELTDDSTVDISYNTIFAPVAADLGGYVLTMKGANDNCKFDFERDVVISNGTLSVTGKGILSTYASITKFDLKGAKLVLGQNIRFEANGSVNKDLGDLTWNSERADHSVQGGGIRVYGRFVPNTQTFLAAEMQNGSTIDLSAKTEPWSVKSSLTKGDYAVTFATGATVAVDLGTRTVHSQDKVMAWKELPEGAYATPQNVRFVPMSGEKSLTGSLIIKSDGLYYWREFSIFIR